MTQLLEKRPEEHSISSWELRWRLQQKGFLTIKHILQYFIFYLVKGERHNLPMSSLHYNGLLENASFALEMGSSIFCSFHQLCNEKWPKLCTNQGNVVNINTNARNPEPLTLNSKQKGLKGYHSLWTQLTKKVSSKGLRERPVSQQLASCCCAAVLCQMQKHRDPLAAWTLKAAWDEARLSNPCTILLPRAAPSCILSQTPFSHSHIISFTSLSTLQLLSSRVNRHKLLQLCSHTCSYGFQAEAPSQP